MQLPQPLGQVLAEHPEELGHPVRLHLPVLGVHGEQQVQVGLAEPQAVQVQRARRRQAPDRRGTPLGPQDQLRSLANAAG